MGKLLVEKLKWLKTGKKKNPSGVVLLAPWEVLGWMEIPFVVAGIVSGPRSGCVPGVVFIPF